MTMDYDREEFELRGWTVKIERDEYPENPRDWDGSFLWLGFPHRRYTFGDVQVDYLEELHIPCGSCDGGKLPTGDCALCDGDGWYHPRSLAEACEQLAAERDALHWEYVWMTEHGTCHYSVGRHAPDRWDSGCAGIMLVTREMAEAWGCNPDNDPDEWGRQMQAEIDQYDAYANGDAWRYCIFDRDGDEYDGWSNDIFDRDACIAEARASVPQDEAPPASQKPKHVTVPVYMIAKVQDWLDGRERMNTLEDAGVADPDEWHASDDDGADIANWLATQLGLTPAPYGEDPDSGYDDEEG